MVDNLTTINHHGKSIIRIDYSSFASLPRSQCKEKTLELLQKATELIVKHPPGSVSALINVANLYFDMEVIGAFKKSVDESEKYFRKMAVLGIKGVVKAAYNFVVGLTQNKKIKTFDSEAAAKDWLAAG